MRVWVWVVGWRRDLGGAPETEATHLARPSPRKQNGGEEESVKGESGEDTIDLGKDVSGDMFHFFCDDAFFFAIIFFLRS